MRELFRLADKNMYIDKNRAKMEEAAEKQRMNIRLLEEITEKGFQFTDCIYCDALLDQYYVLRASSRFFLAEDGSYSGAVEQIVQELGTDENRKSMRKKLQISYLAEQIKDKGEKLELPYQYRKEDSICRGRMTALFVNNTEDGRLHHFILGFEPFQNKNENTADERTRLNRYYEQLKQSIVENENYAEALLQTANAVYTVDLTNDKLENVYYHEAAFKVENDIQTPCSYSDYCNKRSRYVTEDTLENYRIVDSSFKLLKRFATGAKQVTVEYCETMGKENKPVWLQKTVLMSRDMVYDANTDKESSVVHGIVLFKNTSDFHEKEQQEKVIAEKQKELDGADVSFNEWDSLRMQIPTWKDVFLNADNPTKRVLVNKLIEKISVKEDEVVIRFKININEIRSKALKKSGSIVPENKLEDKSVILDSLKIYPNPE